MHHIPMEKDIDLNPKLFHRTSKGALAMGVTAEFLAQTQGISPRGARCFAMRSHQNAAAAHAAGQFTDEIIPVWGHDEAGRRIEVTVDQCVRPDCTMEALARLEPAFMPGMGTVTAGNSSPLNDGAAAMLIMSDERAEFLGLKPLVRMVATAVIGVDPAVMGTGPVPATEKVLKRAGLKLKDIDLIEINEAFAAQVLPRSYAWRRSKNKLNVRGGAIAIGHPLGASGARIATTLIHTMIDREVRRTGHNVHRRWPGHRHHFRASQLNDGLHSSTENELPALFAAQVARGGDAPAILCATRKRVRPTQLARIRQRCSPRGGGARRLGRQAGRPRDPGFSQSLRVDRLRPGLSSWLRAVHVPVHASLSGPQIAHQIVDCVLWLSFSRARSRPKS